MKGCWFKSVLFISLLLGICVFVGVGYEAHLLTKPMLISDHKPIIIVINKGAPAYAFAQTLKSKRLIQSSSLFLLLIRLQGMSHQLQAGIYQVTPGESAKQLLQRIIAGDVIRLSFKIIEGTSLTQVISNLITAPFLFYNPSDFKAIRAEHLNSEGLLLADTYSYRAGSDAGQLLRMANRNMWQCLDYYWENRAVGLPYKSAYELLIAASIIEKEAFFSSEKKIISSVLVNRLRTNMPLQMDPTVIYALNSMYHGKLRHEDLHIDSPYNTYRYRGLPPTPIAMVGKGSIEAAAHPQTTNYLYFVAKGDGSHYFSSNYKEQKKAILRYKTKRF